ncbi:MAG: hypothetical protein M5U32_11760 [Myxococcota bacterium]|nr:hypothetical protein [Myxococcota bacterium]
MNGQTITIASGIILLIVFALVGWNLRRKGARERTDGERRGHDPR